MEWRPSASHNYNNYLTEGTKERLQVGRKKEVKMNSNEICLHEKEYLYKETNLFFPEEWQKTDYANYSGN